MSVRPPKNFDPISAKFLEKMGPKIFGGLNQKYESISFSEIYSSNSCKYNHGKMSIVVEVIRRLVTGTLKKTPELRYGRLCGNFGSD